MKSPFHLLSVVLDGDLEVDVNVGLLGDSDDVRELDGQPRGLVQVVDGKDFQTGTSDHDLGLVNLGALKHRFNVGRKTQVGVGVDMLTG